MYLFPKRIKEISPAHLLNLKKYRNLFILFWLLHHLMGFLSGRWLSLGPTYTLLPTLEFGLLICSVIFLVIIVNRLYEEPITYITIYGIAMIFPIIAAAFVVILHVHIHIFILAIPLISVFLKFLVLTLVAADSRCIFRYFEKENKDSIDAVLERMNKERNNILNKEILVLFAFIITAVLLLFVFPKMFSRLTNGWGGFIFAQGMFIYTGAVYPFYILIKGLVIGVKNIAGR